jgi:general secretion pathway protein I
VHLTVTWKNGSTTESIDLVTHVVSLGPGSDRNGNPAAAAAAAASGGGTSGGPQRQTAPGTIPGGRSDQFPGSFPPNLGLDRLKRRGF